MSRHLADVRPDQCIRVPAGTTAGAAVREAGLPTTGSDAVVVIRDADGALRDLAWAPAQDADVAPVAAESPEGRSVIRHSAAHVLAQAVQQAFPEAKLGIGPPITDGFYYDFDVARPFTPDDLAALEKRMRQIVKSGQRFSRRVLDSVDAAKAELAGEPYKLELIDLKSAAPETVDTGEVMEVGAGELTAYDNLHAHTGERVWSDLCRGPHVPTTRYIPAFRLMRSAAAYWRGSEHNPQLQRIYGTAWESAERLEEHLHRLAEAERRDHRRLGSELDLFSFPDEIGSGLAVWHPKGGIIRRVMEDYSRRRHEQGGYEFVYTPHLTKAALFETSGHLDWYAEGMYPAMHLDAEVSAHDGEIRKPGQDYYLKPMNCPMHVLIYRSRQRSYRELPLRFFEFGSVYRYEKSGVIHGLTRVRGMTQDDAHIFCGKPQMRAELQSLLTFVLDLLRDYGLSDFYLELSTKPEVKAVGSDEEWAEATEALRSAAVSMNLDLVMDEGGGAFYGPKISVQARDAIGRTWQISTIQLDFQTPQRFGITYVDADGSLVQPIMIHRALFGSIERFFAVLLEHYAGHFPLWLAPVQCEVIPVQDDAPEVIDYARSLQARMAGAGLRVEVSDKPGERMQSRIRDAELRRVPYVVVVGRRDIERGDDVVNLRQTRSATQQSIAAPELVSMLAREVVERGRS